MIALRLVAYMAGTDTRKGIMPEPTSLSLSVSHNAVGALELTYSQLADQGNLLAAALESGLDIGAEINWGSGWVEPPNCRFLLIKRSTNPANPAKMITLHCPSYGWLAGKVRNLNLSAVEGKKSKHAGERKFASASAGRIVKTLLDEHQDRRGDGIPLTRAGFSASQDSAGQSWTKTKTLYYPVGVDIGQVLTALADIDHCDWRTQGRALQMWNADTHFTDRASSVKLQIGRELGDAPSEETLEDLVTHILVRGEKKVKTTVQNTSGPHPWGYWEGLIDEGGIDTVAEAQDAAKKELADRSRLRGEYTRTLTMADLAGDSLPFRDYLVGDWVTAPAVLGQQRMRVQQATLTLDADGKLAGSLVLNDRVTAAELKRASKLKSINISGGSTGGTGVTPIPEGPDNRQPAAPAGLAVTDEVYLDAFGRTMVRIAATWAPVSTATDGTELEIASYELWGQPQGQTPEAVWRRITSSTGTEVQWQPFSAGETWTFTVRALGVTTTDPGVQSAPVTVTMGHDTTPPPTPAAGTATAYLGGLTVAIPGTAEGGGAMPPDLARIEMEQRIDAGVWGLVHTFPPGRGTMTLSGLIYDSLYSFRLAAVDLTGNRSGYSATFSATPQRVVETDLGVVLPGDIAYSDVGNLIPDGSFESEAVRDLRNWAPVGDGVWSFVTGQAQHGSWAYQCVSGTATQQYQYLCSDIAGSVVSEFTPATSKIYVSCRVKSAAGATGSPRISARFWPQAGGANSFASTPDRAPSTSWTQIEAVFAVPADTRSVNIAIRVDGASSGTHWFDSVVVKEVIPSMLIEDLAVTNAKIASVAANKITAGEIAAGQYVRAGAANGPHARMDPTGFSAHAPNPAASNAVQPFVRMGTADAGAAVAIGFDAADLEASISADGHAAFQSVTAEALMLAGLTLDDILASYPRGSIAHTLGDATVSGITTTETGLIELRATLQPGRLYKVDVTGLSVRSSVAGDVAELNIRAAYDGGTVSTSSGSIRNGRVWLNPASVYTLQPGFSAKINTGAWGAAREVRLLLTAVRYSGSGTVDVWASSGQPLILEIQDQGVNYPPTTTARRRVTTWRASDMRKYEMNGTGDLILSGGNITSGLIRNTSPERALGAIFGGNGISGEGVTIGTALSGATLHKAELYVYASKGPSSGWSLSTRPSTSTSQPLTDGGVGIEWYDMRGKLWAAPGGAWLDVSSIWISTYRSVMLLAELDAATTILNTAAHPLLLRLTYTR